MWGIRTFGLMSGRLETESRLPRRPSTLLKDGEGI